MTDLYKPIVNGKIVGGRKLLIQAIDKEFSENLTGSYSGDNTVDTRQFKAVIEQARGSDVIAGWMLQSQHLLPQLPVNSEIWLLAGKVNYVDMTCRGTIKRMSSLGRLLGQMNFRAVVGEGSISLEIIGLRGQIIFNKQPDAYQKPEYRVVEP
jgi:hypothetical protein